MSKKFLVAVDGSEHGWRALDLASDLADTFHADLIILHVVPHEPMPEGLEQFARDEGISIEEERGRYHDSRLLGDKITSHAEALARKNGLARVTTRVAEGNPADQIVGMAKSEGADMVFLGSRGLGDIKGLLMGSVSHKVMHLAPCTCVAVK
jgi:nucleotide-binding universal stress UspA family protein